MKTLKRKDDVYLEYLKNKRKSLMNTPEMNKKLIDFCDKRIEEIEESD